MSQNKDRDDSARDKETLLRNKDTNERKKDELLQGKAVEITDREREDKREWQSISRQILEVQELTRETDVEGKTEREA